MSQVLCIGLDAADLDLIERLVGEGRLPHLARILGHGARARVTQAWAYRAELPWTAFVTAAPSGGDGYWGTMRFDPATYATTEQGAHAAEPFYAGGDLDVIAFDVPHSTLSSTVTGIQVTAWGAHSPQYPRAAMPRGALAELDAALGPHPAFDADSQPGWWSDPYLCSLTAAMLEGARRRAEGMVRLMRSRPGWQLAITVFSEPHSAGHHLWHGIDPEHPLHRHPGAPAAAARLEAIYQGLDEAIGTLVDEAGPQATVAVFAVHGSQSNQGDLLGLNLVPELLHRLEFGWARQRNPRHDPIETGGWAEPQGAQQAFDLIGRGLVGHRHPDPHQAPDVVDRATDVARRAAKVAGGLLGPLRDRGGEVTPWYRIEAVAPAEAAHDGDGAIDVGEGRAIDYLGTSLYQRYWPYQRSFALPTFSDLHLRVNLEGREAHGIVPLDGYGVELDRLEDVLRQCRDPRNGLPVFADIVRPRADDPLGTDGPPADLVALGARAVDALEHPVVGRVGPLPFLRTGEHSPRGFLAVLDPASATTVPAEVEVSELGPLLRALAERGDARAASVPNVASATVVPEPV